MVTVIRPNHPEPHGVQPSVASLSISQHLTSLLRRIDLLLQRTALLAFPQPTFDGFQRFGIDCPILVRLSQFITGQRSRLAAMLYSCNCAGDLLQQMVVRITGCGGESSRIMMKQKQKGRRNSEKLPVNAQTNLQ